MSARCEVKLVTGFTKVLRGLYTVQLFPHSAYFDAKRYIATALIDKMLSRR